MKANQSITKGKRLQSMHQMTPNPGHTPRPNDMTQAQKIVIAAIALFAVAGLLVGFTVGKMTKSSQTTPTPITQQQQHATPTKATTPTLAVTPTIDINQAYIGCPDIKPYPSPQNADGATSYTFSAQVKDKSINRSTPCGEGKPLLAPNITCKLWLTKDLNSINSLQKDAPDILKAANFQTPFPKEETTAFTFDPQTPQVQPCSKTGPTTWNYTLSPTLKSGTYYLSIIADWQGKRYNWRSQEVSIQGQS